MDTEGGAGTNNGRQITHCDLLRRAAPQSDHCISRDRICHKPTATNRQKENAFPILPLRSQTKYMSLAIYITEGFGIPFVLFRSSSEAKLNFLLEKTGFLFFNLPICQKRVAWKINLSAEVHMLNAISPRAPLSSEMCC